MRASSVIEFLSAVHQSRYVNGDFTQRGGVILVAPPGQLKSTIIKLALEDYPDALLLSDMNVQTLSALKNSLLDKRYTSLGFGEMEKLYQRNPSTAMNIEGHIKMLVEEGYIKSSFEDPRTQGLAARCSVIGGITPSWYSRKMRQWLDSGFARRFIFSSFTLLDEDAIMEAIYNWKHIPLGKVLQQVPGNKKIDYSITEKENKIVRDSIKQQPTLEGPFVICKKALCVLKWRYEEQKAMDIFLDFAESMRATGAMLELK